MDSTTAYRLGNPAENRTLGFTGAIETPARLTEKYRPTRLAEVVGQGYVVSELAEFAANPFPTAFTFFGPTGIGKTTIATCLGTEIGAIPDAGLHVLKSGTQDAEAVEKVLDTCRFTPFPLPGASGWKLVIVDEADWMSPKAKQLWLSALEDLPPKTVVVFTSNHPEKFEPRFLDRTTRFDFESRADVLAQDVQILADHICEREGLDRVDMRAVPGLADGSGAISFRRVVEHVQRHALRRNRPETKAVAPVVEAPVKADIAPKGLATAEHVAMVDIVGGSLPCGAYARDTDDRTIWTKVDGEHAGFRTTDGIVADWMMRGQASAVASFSGLTIAPETVKPKRTRKAKAVAAPVVETAPETPAVIETPAGPDGEIKVIAPTVRTVRRIGERRVYVRSWMGWFAHNPDADGVYVRDNSGPMTTLEVSVEVQAGTMEVSADVPLMKPGKPTETVRENVPSIDPAALAAFATIVLFHPEPSALWTVSTVDVEFGRTLLTSAGRSTPEAKQAERARRFARSMSLSPIARRVRTLTPIGKPVTPRPGFSEAPRPEFSGLGIGIRGTVYGLELIGDGFRLSGPNGTYDVSPCSDPVKANRGYHCDCPDHERRHAGNPTKGCKHVNALREVGLIPTTTIERGPDGSPEVPYTPAPEFSGVATVETLPPVCGGSGEGEQDTMRTFADFKRRLALGVCFRCISNTYRPEIAGKVRRITKVQTQRLRFEMSGQDGHYWTDLPKAKDFRVIDADTVEWKLWPDQEHTVTLRFISNAEFDRVAEEAKQSV